MGKANARACLGCFWYVPIPSRGRLIPATVHPRKTHPCHAHPRHAHPRRTYPRHTYPFHTGQPIYGKLLVPSQSDFTKLVENLTNRLKCCIPPTVDIAKQAFKVIGQFQGLNVYRRSFHSCGNESWHSLSSDFVVGHDPSPV